MTANPTRSGSGPSDAALVMGARAGERWACEALFRRHAPMVNGLAYRLLGRDAEVDDVVQDSFVQALASLDALKEPQAFASWIASIVVRTASKMIRRRKLLSRLGLRRRDEPIDVDALVGRTVPPDAAAELRALYGTIDAMPVKIRIPLLLRRVEGLSLDEIVTYTGASLATVKRRIAEGEALLGARTGGVTSVRSKGTETARAEAHAAATTSDETDLPEAQSAAPGGTKARETMASVTDVGDSDTGEVKR